VTDTITYVFEAGVTVTNHTHGVSTKTIAWGTGATLPAGTTLVAKGATVADGGPVTILSLGGSGVYTLGGTLAILAEAALDLGTATLVQPATATEDITLGGVAFKGTTITYPAGTVFDGTGKSITLAANMAIPSGSILVIPGTGVLNTGAATLTVGATASTAVTFTKATITGSTASADITLTGAAGTAAFGVESNVTNTLAIAKGGAITTYGEGYVVFGTLLKLKNATTTAGITGTFTAGASGSQGTEKVEITQTGSGVADITGKGGASIVAAANTLTLSGEAAIDIAATYALTIKDLTLNVVNGKINLATSGCTLILAKDSDQAGTTGVAAALVIQGILAGTESTDQWIKAATMDSGSGASPSSHGFAAASSQSAVTNIMIASGTNGDTATDADGTITTGVTTPGDSGSNASGAAVLTVGSGAVTIAGGTNSVLSSGSLLLVNGT
jgi:hypothetical protein